MPITKDVNAEIIEAMRARDSDRLTALRNIKAAFMTEAVALKKPDALDDKTALAVIRRLVKQRKDSAEQFRAGGRKDLAVAEEAELKILNVFLPTQMSEAEVKKIAKATKEKLGVTDKKKIGQLIGAILKETKGQADGDVVKSVVESLFD